MPSRKSTKVPVTQPGTRKKLNLSKETLRDLDAPSTREPKGGLSAQQPRRSAPATQGCNSGWTQQSYA